MNNFAGSLVWLSRVVGLWNLTHMPMSASSVPAYICAGVYITSVVSDRKFSLTIQFWERRTLTRRCMRQPVA